MKFKNGNMVIKALFIALIIIMTVVPNVGYIPTPWLKITLMHIPVIIGAMLYGTKFGIVMGFAFGLSSLITNTFTPNILSFIFSPFYRVGDIGGSYLSLIICFIPRILTGLFAGSIYNKVKKESKTKAFVVSFISSMINTILVTFFIYVFYVDKFSVVMNTSKEAVANTLLFIVGINGVLEAVAAAIIAMASINLLKKFVINR